jgi:hypothetical protein
MLRNCSADSPPLCNTVWHGSNHPAALYHPLPYGRPPPPQKRTAEPSKGRRTTTLRPHGMAPRCQASGSGHLCRHQPCATIPATATPSRPLHHHTRRCGSMRRWDTAMPATVSCMASCQRHPRVLTRTALERATSTPPPSKPLLDAHRTSHDAPIELGFTRTTVYSMALYAMPPHVGEIVRHDCKPPPPWPIKGGAVP